jgi:hypothetical protein
MKHLAVGFIILLTVVLCISVMELSSYNNIANWQLVCLQFAAIISIISCIAAAVAIAETK